MSATAFQRKRRETAANEAKATAPVTREDIATMKRRDVVDHLAAHGVEGATGSLPDLRRWLTRIMFAEL